MGIQLSDGVREYVVSISPPGMADLMLEMVESVWNLSDARNSLYFRGSFSKSHRRHFPLDVDMYYVLNEKDSALPASENICMQFHEWYPDLPRLDLSVFTRGSITNPTIRQMTRLILIYDGTFVCGENILPIIPPVAFNLESAEIIWYKQTEIVAKKICGLEKLSIMPVEAELLNYFYSSVAKSVLRLVMHVFMLLEKTFTRDVLRCSDYIKRVYPNLSDAVAAMLEQISGKGFSTPGFPASAQLLFNSLKWKSNVRLAHLFPLA